MKQQHKNGNNKKFKAILYKRLNFVSKNNIITINFNYCYFFKTKDFVCIKLLQINYLHFQAICYPYNNNQKS